MARIFLYLVLLMTCCISAGAQSFSQEYPSYALRYEHLRPVRDSALAMDSAQAVQFFDTRIRQAHDQHDRALQYHLEKMKFSRLVSDYLGAKQGLDTRKKIEQLEKEGYTLLAAEWYHILGDRYWHRDDYTRGLELELKAYDLYHGKRLRQFPPLVDCQHSLALRYFHFGKYDKAKEYLLQLAGAADASLYDILTAGRYNTLALAYLKLGQTDSALLGFREIYTREKASGKYIVAAIAAGNIGHTYYKLHQDDSAMYWMQEEYDMAEQHRPGAIGYNVAMSAINMADIYRRRGNLALAEQHMHRAQDGLQKSNRNFNGPLSFYLAYAELKKAEGQMNSAYAYMDSARMYTDSVNRDLSGTKIKEAESMMERAHAELKLKDVENARTQSIIIRNAILALVILLAVIALQALNRRREKLQQRQYMMERQRAEIETELANASRQLDMFTSSIHVKNELIEQFTGEIERLNNLKFEADHKETMMQLQRSTILTDEEWDEFRILFEKVHGGFLQRLREKYPEITPAETRYIALVKLDLNNKEMANVLGTGTTAIRNYKYRLRKKLELPDDDSFDRMISDI